MSEEHCKDHGDFMVTMTENRVLLENLTNKVASIHTKLAISLENFNAHLLDSANRISQITQNKKNIDRLDSTINKQIIFNIIVTVLLILTAGEKAWQLIKVIM